MGATKGHTKDKTILKFRDEYHKIWGVHWPENSDYLATLWQEARGKKTPSGGMSIAHAVARERCLNLMRESHDFAPTKGT